MEGNQNLTQRGKDAKDKKEFEEPEGPRAFARAVPGDARSGGARSL